MFRTWNVNIIYVQSLVEAWRTLKPADLLSEHSFKSHTHSERQVHDIKRACKLRRKQALRAIEAAAHRLYHTTTVCRKSYINPYLTELYVTDPRKFGTVVVKAVGARDDARRGLDSFLKWSCREGIPKSS